MLRKLFCIHDWKLLSETTTKSELEICIENNATSIKNANPDRKHIQVVTCQKCGALKRFVEDI